MYKNFYKEIKVLNLNTGEFYNDIPCINNLKSLKLTSPITFFVGENGSGKSTLLEGIANSLGMNSEGGSINYNFETNNTHSDLFKNITLVKNPRYPTDGFYLRAESFYNLATYVDEIDVDLSEYGGKSLHKQSHGESFINLINHRFRGNGIYILDEPEAALSPKRQMSLIISISELVSEGSQFIIATHSPILLAMKNSTIYSFDEKKINEINYEDTSAYSVTKLFIDDRERILRSLGLDY